MHGGTEQSLLLSVALLTVLALAGCAEKERPGPIPEVDTTTFSAVARRSIDEAMAAAKESPDSGAASGLLGMRLMAYRYYDPALACFERAIVLEPKKPDWLHYAGVIELRAKQYAAAVERFQQELALAPDSFAAHVLLAEAHLGAGEPEQAREASAAAVKANPRSARAVHGLGESLEALGRFDEARQQFERALELLPAYSEARFALAELYRKDGEPEKAAELLKGYDVARARARRAVRAPLEDPLMAAVDAVNVGPRRRRMQANRYASSGRLREALQLMEEGVEEEPEQVVYWADLTVLRVVAGDLEGAEESYARAAAIDPDLPAVLIAKGDIDAKHGRYEEALAAFEDAALQSDVSVPALLRAALVLITLNRTSDAEARLRTILDANPNIPVANQRLGLLLAKENRRAEARPFLEKARGARGPETARAFYELGLAYSEAGETDQAQERFRLALAAAQQLGQEDVAKLASAQLAH